MSGFIVDSSCVLSWILDDEKSPEGDRLLESLAQGIVAEAPVLLRYEVANVLVNAFTKRGRLTRELCSSGLADFESLPIRYDSESPRLAPTRIAQIAETHGLSVYDAAYVELALRRSLPLATMDAKLKAVSDAVGVKTI